LTLPFALPLLVAIEHLQRYCPPLNVSEKAGLAQMAHKMANGVFWMSRNVMKANKKIAVNTASTNTAAKRGPICVYLNPLSIKRLWLQ
jgi:hypothetical protein